MVLISTHTNRAATADAVEILDDARGLQRWLLDHVFAGLAECFEEAVDVGEHAEELRLVEELIDDMVVTAWIVQNIPEAVLEVLQSLF